jgi:hypothetical protein
VPQSRPDLLSWLHSHARVLGVTADDSGTVLRVDARVKPADLRRWESEKNRTKSNGR